MATTMRKDATAVGRTEKRLSFIRSFSPNEFSRVIKMLSMECSILKGCKLDQVNASALVTKWWNRSAWNQLITFTDVLGIGSAHFFSFTWEIGKAFSN